MRARALLTTSRAKVIHENVNDIKNMLGRSDGMMNDVDSVLSGEIMFEEALKMNEQPVADHSSELIKINRGELMSN